MTKNRRKKPRRSTKVRAKNIGVIGDHTRVEGGINYYFRLVVSPIGLVVLSIIILTIAYFALAAQNQLPTWLQPRAFSFATDDETLIIVTDFTDRSAGKYTGIDPAQYIYEKLVERAQQDRLNLRIERLYQTVDDNTARSIGERYRAALVLWGWYDAVGITPRLEHITIPESIPGCPTCEESKLQLSAPDTVKFQQNIFATLPSRTTYIVYFTLGLGNYASNDIDKALEYFNGALEIAEQGAGEVTADEVYFYLGQIYSFRVQYQLAIEKYTYAIEINPDFAIAYNNRGNIYSYMGEYDNALADFTRATELDPEDAAAYNNRGITHRTIGEYATALADYTHALDLDPAYTEAYNNRGNTYSVMGDYTKALADFSRAIELKPEDATAYNNRGNAYNYMGEHNNALADFTRAIELNPESAEAYSNRGNTNATLGDYPNALADYTRAIELFPSPAGAYYNRGNTYKDMGDYLNALADFTRAIELDPAFASAYHNRGYVNYTLANYPDALADFTHALELNPDHANAYYYGAITHAHLGHTAEACTWLENVFTLVPDWRDYARTDPGFDPIHDAPCFWALMNED